MNLDQTIKLNSSDIEEILFMKDTGVPADAIADLFDVAPTFIEGVLSLYK